MSDESSIPNKEIGGASPTFLLPLNIAFYLSLVSHTLAALYAPIPDCDETFNYWEPLHYLVHGYGLETWEYSPTYSIRSWAYILQFALPAKLVSLLGKPKTIEFYFVRILLATLCAATETRLYAAICKNLSPRVGIFYLMVAAFTPGFFYASSALLPSSFTMYTSSLGLAAFLDRKRGTNTAQGILWFAIGALLGWPFAGVLIVPFVAEAILSGVVTGDVVGTIRRLTDGALRCLIVLTLQIAIDSTFYSKVVFVPWQIVSYNVFSDSDKGPDIFGTEPWHFYLRNLALNFNVWIVFALLAGPLVMLHALSPGKHMKKSSLQLVVLLSPFYLWLTIFTLQPHKEERFMFPAYPFLALSAAVALHLVISWFGSSSPGTIMAGIPPRIKLLLVTIPMLVAINVGLLRIFGTVTAYRAPLQVFEALSAEPNVTAADNVCIGKEWYRFPSSFFLPGGSHAKFVKSNFDGLLPGEFKESESITGLLGGSRTIPPNMNDRNEEDPEKYINLDQCSYLIDSTSPSFRPSSNEPDHVNSEHWVKVACYPFLDAGSTHILARTIWTPSFEFIPRKLRRVWGDFCLLRRR